MLSQNIIHILSYLCSKSSNSLQLKSSLCMVFKVILPLRPLRPLVTTSPAFVHVATATRIFPCVHLRLNTFPPYTYNVSSHVQLSSLLKSQQPPTHPCCLFLSHLTDFSAPSAVLATPQTTSINIPEFHEAHILVNVLLL